MHPKNRLAENLWNSMLRFSPACKLSQSHNIINKERNKKHITSSAFTMENRNQSAWPINRLSKSNGQDMAAMMLALI